MKKHLTDKEKIEYKYLIELVSSSVNGTNPPVPYENINWLTIKSLARYCSLESLVANAVLLLGKKYVSPELYAKFKRISSAQILIDSNISYETEKILKAFDENKIKNIPLKGYFMKREYPRPDFRSVSDVDILFDRKQADSVKRVFSKLGYAYLSEDELQYHFEKKPLMNIEMHAALTTERDSYYNLLISQLDRSTKRNGYLYSYEMSLEDFYIFMLVHNSTHYMLGGMGIRMVLDSYVFLKNHQSEFNYDYLNMMLDKIGIATYEKRVREIAFNWFAEPQADIKFDDIEEYILLSGTLGRADVGTMVSLQKKMAGENKSRISSVLNSLFPPKNSMSHNYKYLEKAPSLLPFSWCQMWCKRLFIKKDVNFKTGLKNRFSYTDEDVKHYKSLLDEMNLKGYGLKLDK
nr:nucleotidyltransferase family protein [uncultured Ruminococcus sp.]